MKKIYFLFFLLVCACFCNAQINDKNSKALELVAKNSAAIGLTSDDVQNSIVSDSYTDNSTGITMVYLQQSYKGIPVLNQLKVLAFKNGILASNAGTRIKAIEQKVNVQNTSPVVTPASAIRAAMAEKGISTSENLFAVNITGPNKMDFGKPSVVKENITAELMWVPINNGKELKLAWQVYLVPVHSSDYWLLRIDAGNARLLDETNLTVYCDWNKHQKQDLRYLNYQEKAGHKIANHGLFNFMNNPTSADHSAAGPLVVNAASYRVIPFPAESPKHPGGAHALITNPWTAAPGNASTLNWNSDGTTDYNITRGNNVWATEDVNDANSGGLPATSTTSPDPLTFNFIPNYGVPPTQRTPVPNQQFNTTNLFYWNNILHDVLYQYGFDEIRGNFQANNLARGGAGNDYVIAEAQDGGGTSNANFATPADGGRPRMQMYLWDTSAIVTVNTPAAIAGRYSAVESAFSTGNKLVVVGPVTGQVVYYNDNAAATHQGCVTPSNGAALNGKIALIRRGDCNFTVKVKNAQDAGAIAVIMLNNVAGDPIIMGGTDNSIFIPAVMIGNSDSATFVNALANNLNVTLGAAVLDGDVDDGVITHEFGHGLSNRLTGGPAQAGCVSNAENMGEGWSDYNALMFTQDWANSTLTDGFNKPRPMGTYAIGQAPTGSGIRSQKYCTDFAVNSKVYATSIDAESHNRGEIWAATLWDMTWNIINQVGTINPNLYNVAGGGGNIIAMRLVIEGMKLQPCSPGFIDGRNAILQADQLLYGGAYSCAIKEAFRRRGMGPLASQGSSGSVTDQVADFSPTLSVKLTQNVTQIPEGQNIVYTNTVTTCNPVSNYSIRDTLPSNVTYISGGTYDVANRIVSFPVTLTTGQTQTYVFTVQVNNGTYYAPSDLFSEAVAGTTVPATLTASSTTANVWSSSTAQAHSAPNSLFTPNSAVVSNQILTTTNAIALGADPSQLSFWHNYNTETGFDGGVIEISTDNGVNWSDLANKIVLNRYPGVIDGATGTPLAGRPAYTGGSGAFIKSSVNLGAYINQNAKFRWYFSSDNGTAGVGWYVDDILVRREAVVHMRTSLLNNSGTRLDYSDTVTLITQAASCTNIAITTQPINVNACAGSNASFTVVATGSVPSYQWQVSTDGGTIYTNIAGQTTGTLTLTAVTAAMNGYIYHVIVSNACPSSVTSVPVTLTVSTPASITNQPVSLDVCEGANAVFTVTAAGSANTYQWQVSTDGGTTFANIAGQTTNTLTLTGVTAAMNGNQYLVAITSCNPTVLNSVAVTLTVNSLATITAQPVNTNACTGGNATFSVTAGGTNITYQWQVSTNGGASYTNIAGQTGAILTLTGVTAAMTNNLYRVIISNACSSNVTSAGALLTVSNPATITNQPVNATVCAGSNASFSVTAAGTAITYQWQVSTDGGITFTDIPGQTTNTLTLTGVTAPMNNNQYHVIVFSCSPTGLASSNVTLTVNSPASITTQPAAVTVCTGSNASFTVVAAGTNISYQWQVSTNGGANYTDIPGETSATLSLSAVTLSMNSNLYRVVITGAACPPAVNSTGALLTVSSSASITTQPVSTTVCAGSNATFTATASGVSFQWQVSVDGGVTFTDIAGQTTTTLTLNAVTAAMNNNQYRLVVFSCTPSGLNSTSVTLTVNSGGTITADVTDQQKCIGGTATFSVTATGTNLSYQWQVSVDGGITYTDIAGETSATLMLTGLTTTMSNNMYQVILTTAAPCGAVTSATGTLTVNPLPTVGSMATPGNSVCAGSGVTLSGTGAATYTWDNGITNGTPFTANVTTTYTVTGTDAIGCSSTATATITVLPLPTVTITASPYTSLPADLTTTLTATSTPAATVFSWFKDNVLIAGSTTNTIVVDHSGLGVYTASVTDANGCSGTSNVIDITDSVINHAFIYPNPNLGHFYVSLYTPNPSSQKRMVTLYDSRGAQVYSKEYLITNTYEKMEVNIERLGTGVYMVAVYDSNGRRLAKGKVIVL